MRTILLLLLFTTVLTVQGQNKNEVGNLIMENIPEIPDSLRERMNQYQNARGASPSSWSPNGESLLMTTRFGQTSQIHLIKTPLGARKQITFFNEPVGGGSYCPDPTVNGFMFTKDIGGNEFRQLYWYDLNSGKYEMISDGGKTQNSNVMWSENGKRFIYVSTRRNKKDFDLYIGSIQDPKNVKPIVEKEGSWAPLDWSVDEKRVIVRNRISATKSFLFILELNDNSLTPVNPATEEIAYDGAVFNTNGTGIFYLSDQGSDFKGIKYYDVKSGKSTSLSNDIHWDIDNFILSKDRKMLAFHVNEGGISKIFIMDTSTRKYVAVAGLPTGIVLLSEFHPKGNMISLLLNSPQSPSDIYTYDLKSKKLTQWTESEVGGLDNKLFVTPTLIQYETFDKVDGKPRRIPAFYYKPKNAKGKLPVIIDIHGGPEAQTIPFFSAYRTYLTNELGIAVIEPNVRGSSGYGKSFIKLDNDYKREESVQDIGKLLDWIAQQPELDASRVAVSGGSYGGYMVLASLVHYNDRIRCGIDIVGISNFVTFLQNTEDYRKDQRRVEYGDERDPKMKEFLLSISPANHVDKITKPLFIIQGLNDPRVPASESEQMKTNLQAKGGEVWYLVAKDEGHGFRKKENVTFQQLAQVLFLEKYLLK